MYEIFYPDFKFDKVSDIPDSFFEERDIEWALLDIDNTLVPYTMPHPDENAIAFLNRLERLGITYIFVSNNDADRVKLFCDKLGRDYKFISKAHKPLTKKAKEALHKLGAKRENTVLIGDQVFTDVYCGKRLGITTIMVNPLEASETPFFGFKRRMEKVVLKNYKG
ncbi:MAG: HAD-IIIA family hydrolase [Clostridia bacterium]|nr:HAD-IIIA family hydrolase [Clostridia bacterium]